MNEKNSNWLNQTTNWVAFSIVTLCAIFSLIAVFSQFPFRHVKTQHVPKPIVIKLEINSDSLNSKISQFETDLASNLKSNLLNELNEKLREQELSYNEFALREANRDVIITYLTSIGAIILTLTGFFGFRSIREIKIKAGEIAKEAADTTAKETAKERTNALTNKLFYKKYDLIYENLTKTLISNSANESKNMILDELHKNNRKNSEELNQIVIEIDQKIVELYTIVKKCCPEEFKKDTDFEKIILTPTSGSSDPNFIGLTQSSTNFDENEV